MNELIRKKGKMKHINPELINLLDQGSRVLSDELGIKVPSTIVGGILARELAENNFLERLKNFDLIKKPKKRRKNYEAIFRL